MNQLAENVNPGVSKLEKIIDTDNQSLDMKEKDKEEYVEFNIWMKKYNETSKALRKEALLQEKNELVSFDKSPPIKYYECFSKLDRIKDLDDEYKLMEEMEELQKNKQKHT